VDDLAQAAGLWRAHFSREFRRAFGESPHAYLLTRRLERAAALLRGTDRSVMEDLLPGGRVSRGRCSLTTDDCHGAYEELKGRGVEFTEPPEDRPYGIGSGFRDPSGNSIRVTQVGELAAV
jgi:hypothetical protein